MLSARRARWSNERKARLSAGAFALVFLLLAAAWRVAPAVAPWCGG